MAGCVAMVVVMGLCYGHSPPGWMSFGAVGLWCIGYSAIVPFVVSGAFRARATRADVAGAAINAASNAGILLGSAAGGVVLTHYGFAVLTPMAIAVALCGILIAFFSTSAFPHVLHPSEHDA